MKGTDTNYTTDQTQMNKLNITGKGYWLASRDVSSSSSSCEFCIRYVMGSDNLNSGVICLLYSSGSSMGVLGSFGLRPCFALKSDIKITGGNGTSGNPYIMQ